MYQCVKIFIYENQSFWLFYQLGNFPYRNNVLSRCLSRGNIHDLLFDKVIAWRVEHVEEALHAGCGLTNSLEDNLVIITELLHTLDKVGIWAHGHQIIIDTLTHTIPCDIGSNLDIENVLTIYLYKCFTVNYFSRKIEDISRGSVVIKVVVTVQPSHVCKHTDLI